MTKLLFDYHRMSKPVQTCRSQIICFKYKRLLICFHSLWNMDSSDTGKITSNSTQKQQTILKQSNMQRFELQLFHQKNHTCKSMVKEMMQHKAMSWHKEKVLGTAIICGIFFKNLQVPCCKCFRSLEESPRKYQQKQKFWEQTVFLINSRAAELPVTKAEGYRTFLRSYCHIGWWWKCTTKCYESVAKKIKDNLFRGVIHNNYIQHLCLG